ncbi:hypothetical protein GCM10028820_24730 [Tessaracoccus terricola]
MWSLNLLPKPGSARIASRSSALRSVPRSMVNVVMRAFLRSDDVVVGAWDVACRVPVPNATGSGRPSADRGFHLVASVVGEPVRAG